VSQFLFKLPDLGEGTVEAEIVGWRVKAGDAVAEDDVIVEVMTDKAAVEVPSPVSGRVVSTTGAAGDMVPVGAVLIVFETDVGAGAGADTGASAGAAAAAAKASAAGGATKAAANAVAKTAKVSDSAAPTKRDVTPSAPAGRPANVAAIASSTGNGFDPSHADGDHGSARVATSPAIRRRAHEAGVDLRMIEGSGPNGRIVRQDFDAYVSKRVAKGGTALDKPTPLRPRPTDAVTTPAGDTEEIKVIGLRRLIAQRMTDAKRNIPHFAYVEEIDVTELETLRRHLNSKLAPGTSGLTYLPFLAVALTRVLKEFPQANAQYDGERGVIIRHRSVHIGVATQTPEGLKVPVVRDAQTRSLWDLAAEMRRVSEAARTNKATRDELTGSTITITSLGKLGGIASTPIINAPEVAIIGVNRAVERPVVLNGAITIRRMMNLSSSFDHRFVDGYDAAALVQALKERLEHPATIFIDA
jgi:2-oxoisovalerate dehydrogenase E2 component (dihydrolipoyl transacylase)